MPNLSTAGSPSVPARTGGHSSEGVVACWGEAVPAQDDHLSRGRPAEVHPSRRLSAPQRLQG